MIKVIRNIFLTGLLGCAVSCEVMHAAAMNTDRTMQVDSCAAIHLGRQGSAFRSSGRSSMVQDWKEIVERGMQKKAAHSLLSVSLGKKRSREEDLTDDCQAKKRPKSNESMIDVSATDLVAQQYRILEEYLKDVQMDLPGFYRGLGPVDLADKFALFDKISIYCETQNGDVSDIGACLYLDNLQEMVKQGFVTQADIVNPELSVENLHKMVSLKRYSPAFLLEMAKMDLELAFHR